MPWFIFEANIAHFRERLEKETDPPTVATLRKLLAEEEAKLAEYRRNHTPSRAAE